MNARFTLLASSLLAASLVACGGRAASVVDESPSELVDAVEPREPAPAPGQPPPVQCAGFPSCDPGDQQVSSSSGCLQDDATCYSRSMCGSTIWCTGPVAVCEAIPVCQGGFREVPSCPADSACSPVTVCGKTIYCMDSVQCAAVPTCDAGDTQVPNQAACLQDDATCYARSMCGSTIWCTGPAKP